MRTSVSWRTRRRPSRMGPRSRLSLLSRAGHGTKEAAMAKRKVMLKYPEQLIKEPVLFRMAKDFDVMPNIRRARVTETIGEIVAELDGAPENLEHGVRYLEQEGVLVEPVEGDIVE